MVDFDSVRKRIDAAADLVLFDEAVTCHNGGAYRAAYVFAWIAAAEGLLNKLDTMGTAQADIGTFVKKFKAEQDAGSRPEASVVAAERCDMLASCLTRRTSDLIWRASITKGSRSTRKRSHQGS